MEYLSFAFILDQAIGSTWFVKVMKSSYCFTVVISPLNSGT